MTKQPETRGARAGATPAPVAMAAASSASGGRMSAEERRRQIVTVAMRVFSERGFRGTTTKEIAQAAGVSEAIIFRHFATKEELYTAIINHKSCTAHMADMQHPLAEMIRCSAEEAIRHKDDRAVFEGIAQSMMRHHEEDTEFLRLLFYSALEGHQLSRMFWETNVRMMYEFLGSYVRERQRDGAFRAVDPLVVVRAFSGMIIHHSVTNALWDRSRTLLNIPNEAAARAFTEILLNGISSDDSTRGVAAAAAARPAKKTSAASGRRGVKGKESGRKGSASRKGKNSVE